MGLLDFISPALTAATQGVGAYQQGQQAGNAQNATKTMQMIALMRQQHEDEITNQLRQAQVGHLNAQAKALGLPKPADYQMMTDPVTGQVYRVDKGKNTAEDTTFGGSQGPVSPTPTGTPGTPNAPQSVQPVPKSLTLGVKPTAPLPGTPAWDAVIRRQAQIQHSYDQPPASVLTDIDDPAHPGQKIKAWANPRTNTITPTQFNSPASATSGGQTRLPERTQQLGLALTNAIEALPYHDAVLKSGDSPGLLTGWLGEKSQLGHQLARGALNMTSGGQAYEKYMDAINGSLLAVAHSVGGARINKEQINMFGGNMMLSANDPPATIQQKTRAIIDFMNSARATLPPEAVAKQEATLPASGLAYLRSKGYGGAPTAAGQSMVMQIQALGGGGETPDMTASPDVTATPQRRATDGRRKPTYEEWKKAQGIP